MMVPSSSLRLALQLWWALSTRSLLLEKMVRNMGMQSVRIETWLLLVSKRPGKL